MTRPILPSADLDRTASFYAGLGFAVVGRWPAYLILRGPAGIELHFWPDPAVDRWTNDVACWIGLAVPADVDELHATWAASPLPAPADVRSPREVEHLWEFALLDMDGNLLRVGAPRPGAIPTGRPE